MKLRVWKIIILGTLSIVNYKIIYELYFVKNQISFHLEILHTTNMDQALFYRMQFLNTFYRGTLFSTLNGNGAEPRLVFGPRVFNTCQLAQSWSVSWNDPVAGSPVWSAPVRSQVGRGSRPRHAPSVAAAPHSSRRTFLGNLMWLMSHSFSLNTLLYWWYLLKAATIIAYFNVRLCNCKYLGVFIVQLFIC